MRNTMLCLVMVLLSFCIGDLHAEEDSPIYLLELSSIGFPTADKQKDAWNILDLKIFGQRLYLGHGDATVNTGPTDVIYYDLEKEVFVTEFVVDDEGIYSYGVVDGKLVIPGIDAIESWDYGNIYVLGDSGWAKHRTIPKALHVIDVVSFKDYWYATTGSIFELGDQDYYAYGGILRSEDQGETWRLVYSTPTDEHSVYRIRSLVPFQGGLWASVYAYTGMTEEEIPEQYRSALGEPYQEKYLIYSTDVLGESDALVFDENRWKYIDIVPESGLCTLSLFAFQDRLILSALSGEYIDYSGITDGLPPHARSALYTFDGHKTERIPFEYELIKDTLVQNDRLFLLVLNDGRHHIADTSDLKTWKRYCLPEGIGRPMSIEHDDGTFYVGDEKGNIFRSTDRIEVADSNELRGYQPKKIFGAAKLPRDGRWYWSAITGWQDWGELARISCERVGTSGFHVTTENVSEFVLFIPSEIEPIHRHITLSIDQEEYGIDVSDSAGSVVCQRTTEGDWAIEEIAMTAASFEYSRKIIGKAGVGLTRASEDSSIATWLAQVVHWGTGADAALWANDGAREDLRAGDIALEDVYDLTYPNSICLFRATGEALKRMIEFNVKLPFGDRFQTSGFGFTYEAYANPDSNRIVELSLETRNEYTVALPNYYAERAERFLGEEVEFEDTGISVSETIVGWLKEHEFVGETESTVKRIER